MNIDEERFEFLSDLNEKQKKICISEDNILLKACPGSGKTRTLTYKMAYLTRLYENSRKLNIAITYTNRAADEIKKRLTDLEVDIDKVWAGTIHQFCLEYIIRPYSMYSKRISRGYHIIDEYVKEEYVRKITTELNIEVGFNNNAFDFPEVVEAYRKQLEDNKEVDFDSILDISYQLVKDNLFVRENISAILRSILVDEYQDTNRRQYDILSQIIKTNKKIQIMFVGDTDQAIYGGIGGIAKLKSELENEFEIQLKEERLDGCYRSSQRMVDYYSNFQLQPSKIYALSCIKDVIGCISYDRNIASTSLIKQVANIVKRQIEKGIPEEEICIVAPQWRLLFYLSKKIKEYLPDVNFDAPDITPIKYDPMNVFYLIAKLVFTEPGVETWIRKKVANEIISMLSEDYKIYMSDSIDNYKVLKLINSVRYSGTDGILLLKSSIEHLFKELGVQLNCETQLEKAYADFFNKINDRVTRHSLPTDVESFLQCFKEKKGVVVCTFHGVKGEEYTTVIALGILNGYIPHWNSIWNEAQQYRQDETNKLLYVVSSRAKKNLFLFSEQGRTTRRGDPLTPTDELMQYRYCYDTIDLM